ncbi:MAG: DUF167 domain-containing protein [Deltaproteobacteria bacterium]|nr:DUF167 domain-containing protein [Deltaproteobacteria bacterium]
MKIIAHVKTRSKQSKVEILEENSYQIYVKALPSHGKANAEIISLLAKHFKVPKAAVKILQGNKISKKLISIEIPSASS